MVEATEATDRATTVSMIALSVRLPSVTDQECLASLTQVVARVTSPETALSPGPSAAVVVVEEVTDRATLVVNLGMYPE